MPRFRLYIGSSFLKLKLPTLLIYEEFYGAKPKSFGGLMMEFSLRLELIWLIHAEMVRTVSGRGDASETAHWALAASSHLLF